MRHLFVIFTVSFFSLCFFFFLKRLLVCCYRVAVIVFLGAYLNKNFLFTVLGLTTFLGEREEKSSQKMKTIKAKRPNEYILNDKNRNAIEKSRSQMGWSIDLKRDKPLNSQLSLCVCVWHMRWEWTRFSSYQSLT